MYYDGENDWICMTCKIWYRQKTNQCKKCKDFPEKRMSRREYRERAAYRRDNWVRRRAGLETPSERKPKKTKDNGSAV